MFNRNNITWSSGENDFYAVSYAELLQSFSLLKSRHFKSDCNLTLNFERNDYISKSN